MYLIRTRKFIENALFFIAVFLATYFGLSSFIEKQHDSIGIIVEDDEKLERIG